MASNKSDECKKLHFKLIAELMTEIHVGWNGYNQLLVKLQGYGLTPVEKNDSKNDVDKLFEYLERKGLIKVGEYGILLEVLEDLNEPARNLIMEYKAKIDGVSNDKDNVSKKRHASDDPEPSSSKEQKLEKVNKATSTITSRVRSKAEEWTLARMDKQIASNTFVPTMAVKKGEELLKKIGILIYSGLTGEGKTENAFYVMNQWRKEHPETVFIKMDSLSEWVDVDPTVESVIFLDQTNTNTSVLDDDNKWKDIESCIEVRNVKLILTIRQHIFKRYRTKLENNGTKLFMKENVIDLSSNEFHLTETDKLHILRNHCKSRNIEIRCIKEQFAREIVEDIFGEKPYRNEGQMNCEKIYIEQSEEEIVATYCPIGFPYACYLFTLHPKYTKQGAKFFEKPLQVLKEKIGELANSKSTYIDKVQYCLLSYMAMKGGKIDLKNVDQKMFTQIIKSLGINSPSEREKLEAIKHLNDRYIVEENMLFSFKHKTVLESVALCFKDDNIKLVSKYCSEDFITEFVRPMDYKDIDGEEVIKLNHHYYDYIVERFTKLLEETDGDWNNCSTELKRQIIQWCEWWASHPILDDKQFVDLLMNFFKSDESYKIKIQNCVSWGLFKVAFLHGKHYLLEKLCSELKIHVDVTDDDIGKWLPSLSTKYTGCVFWLLDHNIGLKNERLVQYIMEMHNADTFTALMNHQNITLNHAMTCLNYIQYVKANDEICTYSTICYNSVCDTEKMIIKESKEKLDGMLKRLVDVMLKRWPDMDKQYVLQLLSQCLIFDSEKVFDAIITRRYDVVKQQVIGKSLGGACLQGSKRIVEFIVNKHLDTLTQEIIKECFTLTCAGGHIEILNYFLDLKLPNIDMTSIYVTNNDENITNLHVAAYFGYYEVLVKLIKLGLDVNDRSKTGMGVMYYAMLGYTCRDKPFTSLWKADLLEQMGFKFDSVFLCVKDITRHLELLYQCKIIKGEINYTLILNYLVQNNDLNLADLDIPLDEQFTTVGTAVALYCVKYDSEKTLDILMNRYKNRFDRAIYSKTNDKISCLHIAAFFGRFDMFKMLVEAGLSVADKDRWGRSVVQFASIGFKYGSVFEPRVQGFRSSLNLWYYFQDFLSYYNTDSSNIAIMASDNDRLGETTDKKDFENGAVVEEKKKIVWDISNERFFHSCENNKFPGFGNFSAILVYLIRHKDVNIKDLEMVVDDYGCTLAHYLVVSDDPSVIMALCDVNPSLLSVENKYGHKPIDYAVRLGRDAIFKMLYPVGEQNNDKLCRLLQRDKAIELDFFQNKVIHYGFSHSYDTIHEAIQHKTLHS